MYTISYIKIVYQVQEFSLSVSLSLLRRQLLDGHSFAAYHQNCWK